MSGPRGEAGYGLETGVGTGIEHAEGVKERPARGRFPARANRGPICHLAPFPCRRHRQPEAYDCAASAAIATV